MTTIKAFIKSHPLLSYFALAFAITWGTILIVVGVGPTALLATSLWVVVGAVAVAQGGHLSPQAQLRKRVD